MSGGFNALLPLRDQGGELYQPVTRPLAKKTFDILYFHTLSVFQIGGPCMRRISDLVSPTI